MEITEVRCVLRAGTLDVDPDAYVEAQLVSPTDVYDGLAGEDVDASEGLFPTVRGGDLVVEHAFAEVEAETGHTGLIGPLDLTTAHLVLGFADRLVGCDARRTEWLWDVLYRGTVHGRRGRTMLAISAIDCALWDLKGKYYGEPVYRLLGGPTRERLPAYASMLWFPTEPEAVRERVDEFVNRGYGAQKWFFEYGPGAGREGIDANVALAEAARDAAGDGYELMFDAWMGWDRSYAEEMIDRLAPVQPAWLEEPVHPDALEAMTALTAEAPFPIATGEHEYTRWGFADLLSRGACDVIQPDPLWSGGISEVAKICTLATTYDHPVALHGISVPASLHLVAAHPPTVTPYVEYLVRPNETLQHFFAEPFVPDDGSIALPERPGLGIEIDEAAVEAEREIVRE